MNDLLFTALTLTTLYYFFYYLPDQEKANQPISISRAVQTDPLTDEQEKLLENTLDELIKQIKQLQQTLK
jgi:hypothetical protein